MVDVFLVPMDVMFSMVYVFVWNLSMYCMLSRFNCICFFLLFFIYFPIFQPKLESFSQRHGRRISWLTGKQSKPGRQHEDILIVLTTIVCWLLVVVRFHSFHPQTYQLFFWKWMLFLTILQNKYDSHILKTCV